MISINDRTNEIISLCYDVFSELSVEGMHSLLAEILYSAYGDLSDEDQLELIATIISDLESYKKEHL